MNERTCTRTGFRIIEAAGEPSYRVAQDRYGAVSVLRNDRVGPLPAPKPGVPVADKRGRYDTLGSTVYLADSRRCAYAEVLSGFRRERAAVAKAAESIGWTVDEYMAQVVLDAKNNGVDVPWAISVDWQFQRSIYEISLPSDGWWIKIDHKDTLSAFQHLTPPVKGMTAALQFLTAGSITGNNRALTTILSQTAREQVLDNGYEPLGISFESKTLFGRCWAFWDRRVDSGLAPGSNDLQQRFSENVGPDPDFNFIADHYELPRLGR